MKDIKWMGKAMVLGISFFIAVLLVKPVGVSTQFSVITGIVHSIVDPGVITENSDTKSGYESTNAYYNRSEGKLAKSIKNPMNYSFIFFLAIPVGGYLGYLLLDKSKNTGKPKAVNKDNMIPAEKFNIRDYIPSFISGILLLYGARMAGGCTSGHMMSGIMQGSISGFIFAGAVFVVAIPVAIFASNKGIKGGRL